MGWCARRSTPAWSWPSRRWPRSASTRPRRNARSTLFRDHDEKNLLETHAIYRDEQQLIQSEQQAADELASLFEADRP